MNKLIIVLLAVCLVSVHAFVKRDTATPDTNVLQDLGKNFENLQKSVQGELGKIFDAEKIKSDFAAAVDKLSDVVESMKPKAA